MNSPLISLTRRTNDPKQFLGILVDGDAASRSEVVSTIPGLFVVNTRKIKRVKKKTYAGEEVYLTETILPC